MKLSDKAAVWLAQGPWRPPRRAPGPPAGKTDYFGSPARGNITHGIIRLEMVFWPIEIESFLSNLIQMEISIFISKELDGISDTFFHIIDLKLTYRINYFTHYYFYFMGLILCFTLLVSQSISQFLIIFKSL